MGITAAISSNLEQSVEKLKEKWTAWIREIMLAIAEEEMKISREEFDRQIGTCTRQSAHFKRSQWERRTAYPDTKRVTLLVSDATDQPQDRHSLGSNSHA